MLEFFAAKAKDENYIDQVLDSDIWEYDLSKLGDFKEVVRKYYEEIKAKSIREVMKEI